MAHLSNPRIDFAHPLGVVWAMRFCLCLPLIALTACTSFPQVDAVLSKNIAPRPALLTLGQINDLMAKAETENSAAPVDDLATRAADLRNR